MKHVKSLSTAIVILFLAGCATAVYNYQAAENVDFQQFETYAFLPDVDTNHFSVLDSEIVHEKTLESIKEEMDQRGYTLDTDVPDLLILPHYLFSREKELIYDPIYPTYDYYYPGFIITPWHRYYYAGYHTIPRINGPGWREVRYTEGTIVVDIINTENNRLIFRGWSEDRIDPRSFTRDVEYYIENIFKNYPVKER